VTLDALDHYLAGDATPAEAERIRARLRALPGLEAALEDEGTYTSNSLAELEGRAPSWDALATRIAAEQVGHRPATSARFSSRQTHVRPWTYVGGAALTVLAVAAGIQQYRNHVSSARTAPVAQYATHAGQHAQITLPDGSRATLGPATTVRATTTRRGTVVTIDGEALFAVAHGTRAPFTVHTRQSLTHVLGTVFAVRQYATDRVARIVVTEGRVSVRGTWPNRPHGGAADSVGTEGVLAAGGIAVVNDSGQVTVTPGVATQQYTAWASGELVFRAAPVRDVVGDLARTYGVVIQLTDSTLANRRIDWDVHATRYSLAQVLPELLLMLNAHAQEQHSGVITVMPGPGASSTRRRATHPSLSLESQYGR